MSVPVGESASVRNSLTEICIFQLIHKVQNGLSVKDAVQTIVAQGVGELRKAAFGDDVDDAKDLPWKPEQAWIVLKQLAKHDEVWGDELPF